MPSRAQRSERRRALRLLAGAPQGVTEALMLAHGFRVELCSPGSQRRSPSTCTPATHDGDRSKKITEAGRQAAQTVLRAPVPKLW